MAMSDTGSSFAHWAGLYDREPPRAAGFADGNDNNAISTAAATSSPTKVAAQQQHPGVEGPRVGKPARRRSRASRRAPVTLLNTDTSNFRAMVQQFTGIPVPPAGAFGASPLINFAGDYGFAAPHPGVMSFHHRSHSQHQQHPPVPLHDQLCGRPQYTTGAAFGYNGLLQGGDVFAAAEDRMLLQSMQAAQMPPPSAANNTSLGFFA